MSENFLFAHEEQVIQYAEALLAEEKHQLIPIEDYKVLVREYKKLFGQMQKLVRLSDYNEAEMARRHKAGLALKREVEEENTWLAQRIKEQVQAIGMSQMETIFALSKLAESRDPETGAHLERMREYCKLLAITMRKQGLHLDVIDDDYIQNLYVASPLHDIGKVGVPDHILLKPGKLTEEEFEQMKQHSLFGAETLKAVNQQHGANYFVQMGIEIAESHHEKWDGTGYPHGLSGATIPLCARILALADVYDALRSRRCYKEPFSHEKSRNIILDGKGKHFDPDIVDCFMLAQGEFEQVWDRLSAHEDA